MYIYIHMNMYISNIICMHACMHACHACMHACMHACTHIRITGSRRRDHVWKADAVCSFQSSLNVDKAAYGISGI